MTSLTQLMNKNEIGLWFSNMLPLRISQLQKDILMNYTFYHGIRPQCSYINTVHNFSDERNVTWNFSHKFLAVLLVAPC